ncbi:heat shock 70 kDa protein 14-like [Chelonus insularis]|uniref:heat shock 70 kDa protein 14-like n=1 Tax=Chelonus insularis TaxID=460826 RepID=UPI0015887B2F|nr:heat shock 70 kDa protein 14-like [Chelonus insularis]
MTAISFGLYLGNTSACLAIYKDENVDVVANHAGDRVTSAVIAFSDSERVIGTAAKAGLFRNGMKTVLNNKRLMNKEIDATELEDAIQTSTSKIINESGSLQYSIKINDKTETFSPQEISTMLFKAMYDISTTAAHDDEEHKVVLCVPCKFSVESIKAWRDSASKAGFKVLQVIGEPVASCLTYGIGKEKKITELVLVYRIGGISSDISLIKVSGSTFRILSTQYHPKLGGHKLTDLLVSYLAEEFRHKYKIDPTESRRSIAKLKNEAEKCKHILSTMSTAHCFVESLCEGVDFSHNITRARFENIISPYISEYIQPIMDILQETSKTVLDIKKIILCGGTMKIPKLQEKIGSIFPCGEVLSSRWSPDEIMAVGAALQSAHLLSYGMVDKDLTSTDIELHCLAKSICVKIDDIDPIVIPKDTVVPIKIQTIVEIPKIPDKKITIDIFEVENDDKEISTKIGLISLNCKTAGKWKIDTDLTEMNLNIHITEMANGKKSSFRFPIHADIS